MRADLWKALLHRIPEEMLDNLVLATGQGTEINVQALLRMEEEVVILRGRIAGSNDTGKVFLLPYEHLDHIAFQRPLTDAQLEQAFGITPPAPTVPTVQQVPEPQPVAAAAPAPAPQPAASPPPAAPAGGLLSRLPTRAEIIRRLRQRTQARDGGETAAPQ
jgi:hypothetical protein